MISLICPHCSKTFLIRPYRKDTAKYCSKNCANEHKRIRFQCAECGITVVRKRKDAATAKFCSRVCQGEWRSRNLRGPKASNYRTGSCCERDKAVCKVCGESFLQIRRYLNKGFGDICSKECRSKLQSAWQRSNSPCKKEKIRVTCEMCEATKDLIPSFARTFRFCSKKCRNNWQSTVRMRGANHPMWNEGAAELRSRLGATREYKAWRLAVFKRDKFTCQHCGDKKGGNLHAHHIKFLSSHPELAFDVTNGLTLCKSCHEKYHQEHSAERGNGKLKAAFDAGMFT